MVDELLKGSGSLDENPELPSPEETPDYEDKDDSFNEDGEIDKPFDEVFPDHMEDEVVEYDEETVLVRLANSFNGKVTSAMKTAGVAKLEKMFSMEKSTWYEAFLNKDSDAKAAVESLRELDDIELVEYNFEIKTTAMDDYQEVDSFLLGNKLVATQWYLNYCGFVRGSRLLKNPGGSPSVTVAVIDTGVDYNHYDLHDNIWVNADEIPDNGKDDDKNGYVDDYYGVDLIAGKGNAADDNGHGTHVAGIIAAQNNHLGTVGIAYNTKIMPIKAAMASGYLKQADIAKAILYAYENGAEVINMSFGGSTASLAVQDALKTAYTRCVLVASAGNEGAINESLAPALPNFPASLSYVIGVMSIGRSGVESQFTNFDGKAYSSYEYEVYAPGEEIISTVPGNKYASWSGTSMAAPIVSAVAALVRSQYPDRNTYPTKFIYGQITSTSEYSALCPGHDDYNLDPYQHNVPNITNLYSALTKLPEPEVGLSDYYVFDTEGFEYDVNKNNNGDGVIDAGETLALGLTLRNRWGMSENTKVKIDVLSQAGIADPYIEIINPSVDYGSIGTYSTGDCGKIFDGELFTGWANPFYIRVAEDCPNDYIFRINVKISCENALDEKDWSVYTSEGAIELKVRNGYVLPSIIDEDMTLTADNLYIIPNATNILEGVTVTVEPGTHIQFWTNDREDPYADEYIAYLRVEGNFLVEGSAEDPVYIYPSELMKSHGVNIYKTNNGYVSLKHADIDRFYQGQYNNSVSYAGDCIFRNSNPDSYNYYRYLNNGVVTVVYSYGSDYIGNFVKAENCVFYKIGGRNVGSGMGIGGTFDSCAFIDCGINLSYNTSDTHSYSNCLFYGNGLKNGSYYSKSSYTASTTGLESITPSAVNAVYNPETDTTYVAVDINKYSLLEPYMKSFGWNYAVIETEEELAYLQSTPLCVEGNCDYVGVTCTYVDGFYNYFWSDGTPVGSFIRQNQNDSYYSRLYLYAGCIGNYSYNRILLEIPGEITAEEILNKVYSHNRYFHDNVILNRISTDYDVERWLRVVAPTSDYHKTIPFGNNYWGTADEKAIGLQIVDYTDYPSYAQLDYTPFLATAPENTFPFVTDVKVLNEAGEEVTTVGNEKITVRVSFNRDMDESIPLDVRFGSAEPYADYEIDGAYVDARTWEGTITLSTTVENGNQYFTIKNGKAKGTNLKFFEDTYRFSFAIDTTAAQAMIMQGSATDEGIELSWMQDDFDTLMGYNVYRSTSEDGYYQRLNSTVLPSDVKTFFDDTVEPGVVYYYNFTVVKTDLTESTPSGKITIMSKDTMAPDIYHTPVYTAKTGSNIIINATITDNLIINTATVYYRTVGETEWKMAVMNKLNDKYSAIIYAEEVSTEGIEYYIDAFDGISHAYRGSEAEPYVITVQEALDDSALGDVNGDGKITNLDALMLLQAINDLLNLDADQFARADLNGDGVLAAAEALRILQYVSGEVGSVKM